MAARVASGSGSLVPYPSAGPQLQEITSAPLSAAHSNIRASSATPRYDGVRTAISEQPGAAPDAFAPFATATPAQEVPCASVATFGFPSAEWFSKSYWAVTLPANSACPTSTPSSRTATWIEGSPRVVRQASTTF